MRISMESSSHLIGEIGVEKKDSDIVLSVENDIKANGMMEKINGIY